MPSLRIATSPERGAENQHAWMYNAAAVWHDDPPSLSCVYTQAPLKIIMTSCKQKPFWAVIVIGSTERARQCTTTPRFGFQTFSP